MSLPGSVVVGPVEKREDAPVIENVQNTRDLTSERLGRQSTRLRLETLVQLSKVVENWSESSLEHVPILPLSSQPALSESAQLLERQEEFRKQRTNGVRNGGGAVGEDVRDEEQPCDLDWYRRLEDHEALNDHVSDLVRKGSRKLVQPSFN